MLDLNQIYCGDCLDLMREMPDKSVDLVLTDPPYGIKLTNEKLQTRKQCADPIDYGHFEWDMEAPDQIVFLEMFRVSKNQIIFGGNYFALFPSPCWIVWDKDNSGDFADAELAWTSFTTPTRIFKYRWNGMIQQDMAHKEKREHPTQKPLPLMMWCLEKYSDEGMTVLDPFMGSGTTCVACKKLGRKYIGIDKEPAYVEIARKRIERANNHKLTDFW